MLLSHWATSPGRYKNVWQNKKSRETGIKEGEILSLDQTKIKKLEREECRMRAWKETAPQTAEEAVRNEEREA